MSEGQELKDWGSREGLSPDVITVLLDQGFGSMTDLRDLSPDDVDECFQKTHLLTFSQSLALRNAIGHLSSGGPPPYSPDGRGFSPPDDQFQPGGPSPYGQQHGPDDPGFTDPPHQTYQHLGASYQARESPCHPQDAPHRPAFEQESYTTHGAGRSRPQYDEPGLSAAMGATSIGDRHSDELRLLLVGKTGSGKSMTGNTIFGETFFPTSVDSDSAAVDCELKRSYKDGSKIEIMDSPGLFDTTKNHEQVGTVIIKSVAGMHPGPNAILYVFKIGGRYTAEEYSAYTRLKALFDPNITRYMIVLFTGGDTLESTGESIDSWVQRQSGNIKTVLTECSHRYVLFNNKATDPRPQVERLLDMVRQLNRQNGGPYVCPKYGMIGESLEAEVARRMEEVDKKELEGQKYVQQLQKQTEDTQQALTKTKEDMQHNEREQKRQMEQLAKQQEQQTKLLKQQMELQKLSDEKRLQEARALQARQQEEQQKMVEGMEQQRREDLQRIQAMEKKRQRLEAELAEKERERQEERDRRQKREQDKARDEFVKDILLAALPSLLLVVFKAMMM